MLQHDEVCKVGGLGLGQCELRGDWGGCECDIHIPGGRAQKQKRNTREQQALVAGGHHCIVSSSVTAVHYLVCGHWLSVVGSLVCLCWKGWAAPGWCSPFWGDTGLWGHFGATARQPLIHQTNTSQIAERERETVNGQQTRNGGTVILILSVALHTGGFERSRVSKKDDRTIPVRWWVFWLAGHSGCNGWRRFSCNDEGSTVRAIRGTVTAEQNWKQKWLRPSWPFYPQRFLRGGCFTAS